MSNSSISEYDLKVEIAPIAKLKPAPRNARRHSKAQVRQIIASFKEFGFLLTPAGARPALCGVSPPPATLQVASEVTMN